MPNDHAPRPQPVGDADKAQRLHKVLARAGVASRRGAEQLIAEGRVSVDGRPVTEQGVRVDPETAVVAVDGKRIAVDDRHATYLLNKPKGVVTAMSVPRRPASRPPLREAPPARERCVGDLLRARTDLPAGLFHVGRLDADTTGLLLVTNHGELAHRLAHPSYEIPKTYLATVRGAVGRNALDELRRGVALEDGPARADSVAVTGAHQGRSVVEITLHEGRNRIVRRMLDAVGLPVVELARLRLGPIKLGDTRAGMLRALSPEEVGALWAAVDRKAVRP